MTLDVLMLQNPRPRWHELTVIAQDPSVSRPAPEDGKPKILTARVRVPADLVDPGPRSHRFHVVDYDEGAGRFVKPREFGRQSSTREQWPITIVEDRFENATDTSLTSSELFRAQNVYAIAARTLASFEGALGRRVPWSFASHQLYLVPHALAMENAYYSPTDEGILFGYFKQVDGTAVDTCLSHDVIAHETTHAVLDGLRPRLLEYGLPDQAGFHEGFADIVALLSVFSMSEVIRAALWDRPIAEADAEGFISAGALDPARLKRSMLFSLAEQWGGASSSRGSGLRNSMNIRPNPGLLDRAEFQEPHRRGEILVSAVMNALLDIWEKRVKTLIQDRRVHLDRAADEGAKSAGHLLNMLIRALDYCPPVEFEFADFLDAILVSDAEVAPDDEHGYRDSLRRAFKAFGIEQPRTIADPLADAFYDNLNFDFLRTDRDEVFRFLWQNGELVHVNRDYYTHIDQVWPSVRVGPDGFVVAQTVATYVQQLDATLAELVALSGGAVTLPAGVDGAEKVRVWGGGVLVFDQFGRAKYHQRKPLNHWLRQDRRLKYLAGRNLLSGGLTVSSVLNKPAFSIHAPGALARAEW